jgi:hypothetical protein
VLDNNALVALCARHVLFGGEKIVNATSPPGSSRVVIETDGRLLAARVDNSLLDIGRAGFVSELAVFERYDMFPHGRRESDVVAVTSDAELHLNDTEAAASLGQRVLDDLDPVAYAEILVAYHPWTAARRELVRAPDQLTAWLGLEDPPEVGALRRTDTGHGATLEFDSATVYSRGFGTSLRCDVHRWRAEIARDHAARWGSELVAGGLAVPVPTG